MFQIVAWTRRIAPLFSCVVMIPLLYVGEGRSQTNVFTQHNDNNRDGLNATETALTPANVNQNQFGLLFKVVVDDQVYTQPLYMANVNISGGTHNVVFVATANNSVYAFDADSGTQYWHVQLGPAFTIQNGGFTCKDVLASSGIMSTPVINPSTNTIYVVAETERLYEGLLLQWIDLQHHSKVQVTGAGDGSSRRFPFTLREWHFKRNSLGCYQH